MKNFFFTMAATVISAAASFAQIPVKYHGEVNAGYSVGVGSYAVNRVNLNTIQGVQVGEYFSTGLGIGLDWYRGLYADYWEEQGKPDMGELAMPIYLNMKGYLPVTKTIAPYLTFDIGYGVGLTEGLDGFGGLYMTPGIGIKAGKFKAEIGLNVQRIVDIVNVNANAIKLVVGYIF